VRCSSLIDWPVYPRLRDTMQASTRARNKPMQGRNFSERPRLGTTNGRPRRGRPWPGAGLLRRARRVNGAAETLAQVTRPGCRYFLACAISFRPRRSAASMTPGQDEGKAEIGSDELSGGAWPIRLGKEDFSRIRLFGHHPSANPAKGIFAPNACRSAGALSRRTRVGCWAAPPWQASARWERVAALTVFSVVAGVCPRDAFRRRSLEMA
jgi:hypothetical protein